MSERTEVQTKWEWKNAPLDLVIQELPVILELFCEEQVDTSI